ncbi:MAG: hypothetical protein JWR09_4857 [Mucilaginibacter sp.]|nr:hypothetical protein [Mucilaginibacter sp.]
MSPKDRKASKVRKIFGLVLNVIDPVFKHLFTLRLINFPTFGLY